MEFKNYTVVSCNNCSEVWVVKDVPNQSQCPQCSKTRKFQLLKKYRSVDSLDKAQLIRSQVKAKLSGNEEKFQELLESGDLTFDSDNSSSTQSFESICYEAIDSSNSKEEFLEYFSDTPYSRTKAKKYYERKRKEGKILESSKTIRLL